MKYIVLSTCFVLSTSGLFAAGKPPVKGKPAAPAGNKPAPAAPAGNRPAPGSPAGNRSAPSMPMAPAVSSTPAHTSAAGEGGKYGMAGCGLGALVIHSDEMLPQVASWFLNGLSSNQTYAISFGTSNCVQGRSEIAAMEQEVYFAANLSSISKEAAQGSGEHLEAVAEVLGCREETDKTRLGELSQVHYAEIFAAKEPEAVLQRYLTVVNADPQLAKSCGKAS